MRLQFRMMDVFLQVVVSRQRLQPQAVLKTSRHHGDKALGYQLLQGTPKFVSPWIPWNSQLCSLGHNEANCSRDPLLRNRPGLYNILATWPHRCERPGMSIGLSLTMIEQFSGNLCKKTWIGIWDYLPIMPFNFFQRRRTDRSWNKRQDGSNSHTQYELPTPVCLHGAAWKYNTQVCNICG